MSSFALLTGAMKYAGSSFLEMVGRNSVNLCWEEVYSYLGNPQDLY